MPIATRSDLFAALARERADDILGTAENSWLDFKRSPYVLTQADQALELAKDITALANSGGGVLLIGFETERELSTAQDVARSWKRVPKSIVNVQQYRDVVSQWTYPPVHTLDFRWWIESGDSALLTIEFGAASEGDSPILVTRVVEGDSKRGILLGIFQRPGNSVSALLPAQIHTLIRMGRMFERMGGPERAPIPPPPTGPTDEERAQRLLVDVRDSGLEGHRRYFLQAWPLSSTEVRRLHDRTEKGFRTLLSWPPALRDMGFGLRTRDAPTVIAGGGLRVLTPRWTLSLQPDGLLTWVVTAGSDFLAWADERRGRPLSINSIALVESTFEFVRLFMNEVLPACEPAVAKFAFMGGMANLHEDGVSSSLTPGRPGDLFARDPIPVPTDSFNFGPVTYSSTALAESVALDILRRIYQQFGLPEEAIPFSTEGAVDTQKLVNA